MGSLSISSFAQDGTCVCSRTHLHQEPAKLQVGEGVLLSSYLIVSHQVWGEGEVFEKCVHIFSIVISY